MKRIYLLDGMRIYSDDVVGFLHKARKNRGECASCLNEIKAGQEYIILNNFDPYSFHRDCFGEEGDIIGIGTHKILHYGLKVRAVICKRFKKSGEEHD